MNRYNEIGMEVLAYKAEMDKQYPPLVRSALESAVDQMQENSLIDLDVHFALKNKEVSNEEFKQLLLEKKNLVKSAKELLSEYDALRVAFDEELRKREVFQKDNLSSVLTESKVEEEQIHVICAFKIDSDFAAGYFGKADEEELEKLMKRKGFVERFVLLRYNKMMSDFLSKHEGYDESVGFVEIMPYVYLSASQVYYGLKDAAYYSEFMIYIDIKALEDGNYDDIVDMCEEKIGEINDYIHVRTLP